MPYRDLLIQNDDLTLDAGRNPQICTNRDVIAQDIVHMIREEGFLPPLVANRNRDRIEQTLVSITIAVENDIRIRPGTVGITETASGIYYLTAETMEFGPIAMDIS